MVEPTVCLVGPTASGKTALALELARRVPLGVISIDSTMVYRHFDIGSGKPTPAERAAVRHWLIDIREPQERYSVGEFVVDARIAIQQARAAGLVPLLVGGTMLYLQGLQRGLSTLPAADPAVRAGLDREAAERGWPALHAELERVDPGAASRIAVRDRQRIQRALEVYRITGMPLSALQRRPTAPDPNRYLNVVVDTADRTTLHARIARRLETMLAVGLVAEVEKLVGLPGMDATHPALRAVGYRQVNAWLGSGRGLDELRLAVLAATRQLARRQLTWLRPLRADLRVEMAGPEPAAERRAVAAAVDALVPELEHILSRMQCVS